MHHLCDKGGQAKLTDADKKPSLYIYLYMKTCAQRAVFYCLQAHHHFTYICYCNSLNCHTQVGELEAAIKLLQLVQNALKETNR